MKKETQAKTQSKMPAAKKPNKQNKAVKWIVIGAIAAAVVVAAIGFCAVIGILFGGYPAAKASRLQPIEALRAE